MKVALLTTDMPHHAYIAWEIYNMFSLQAVFFETKHVKPPFRTVHAFDGAAVEYELEELLAGLSKSLEELVEVRSYCSLNDGDCVEDLCEISPDVVIVAGTGLLKASIIGVATQACLNLHGGHPEEYRGLDSLLWAIYHGDFDSLAATLHYVDHGLDTGDIVMQQQLDLSKETKLHELRAINAKACAKLACSALCLLERGHELPRRRQQRKGRYYSFMPHDIKELCLEKFSKHVAGL